MNAAELNRLVERCGCCFDIGYQPQKAVYETIEQHLTTHDWQEVSAERAKELDAGGVLWELQIYPRNPVGFYIFYGATLDEVVAEAHATLDETGEG